MNPNSAPNPIDPSETPPPGENPGAAKGGPKKVWVAVMFLAVTPLVTIPFGFIFSWLAPLVGGLFLTGLGLLLVAAVPALAVVAWLVRVGLRRNWAGSPGAWGLLGAFLFIGWGAVFWLLMGARASSDQKAVMGIARQISAAADQYYLEYGGSSVRLEELVGPDRYIKQIYPVAGETYPSVLIQGHTITITGVAGLRTVTYAP
jgi:hypothetical protein